ncbi:ATP-binding protein [Planomonospora sp. ID67723]|uniref:ATP-binding protein n=1 Tax=Planomonospora sp. ID67723 TaxID=2738134 RepID=UPI0018C41E1C|nr:ATP-binding protein [Planomonospora sp. ID67723]MBG0829670.1 ATP-binding protein [Planomonospora sp. ID67723]
MTSDRIPRRGGHPAATPSGFRDERDGTATHPSATWEFSRSHAGAVRRAVAEYASHRGLEGMRRSDFVLAVYEGMTNAIRYGGGRGRVRLWTCDGLLNCEVADHGPGIPVTALTGDDLPPDGEPGRRGLWLIRNLSESCRFTTGPEGTTIRITFRLTGQPPAM